VEGLKWVEIFLLSLLPRLSFNYDLLCSRLLLVILRAGLFRLRYKYSLILLFSEDLLGFQAALLFILNRCGDFRCTNLCSLCDVLRLELRLLTNFKFIDVLLFLSGFFANLYLNFFNLSTTLSTLTCRSLLTFFGIISLLTVALLLFSFLLQFICLLFFFACVLLRKVFLLLGFTHHCD